VAHTIYQSRISLPVVGVVVIYSREDISFALAQKTTPKTLLVPKKQQRRGEEVIIIIIIMARRGGKKTHQLEDQYGGFSDANANDTFRGGSGFGGGGFKGGGFGGGGKGGPTLKYERVVPKFLRHHADLLVGNALEKGREDQNEVVVDEDEETRRGVGHAAAATTTNTNAEESREEECLKLKGVGNRCFQNGEYERAVDMFTKCIAAQGSVASSEDNSHIYYSNRSAAYVKLGQFELAKRDALESIERSRGEWAKGWVRLAVASVALDDLTTHAKAYERAFKLEPHNEDLKEKMHKAKEKEREAMEMGLFKFKSRKDGTNAETSAAKSEGAKKESKEISGGKRKNRIDGNAKEKKRCKKTNEGGGILSFDEEEEEREEER
tara:strand:- start:146 stop:1285 length:1140 start_codon:yes stop_codon:yes gene_type:complete